MKKQRKAATHGDRYYGATARDYDRRRTHKKLWKLEADAVAQLVHAGPVLDVPLGTARFGELYRSRGIAAQGVDISPDMLAVARRKHPEIPAQVGSILALPFEDGQFQTAVCTRLLNWLGAEDASAALDELQRVARDVVFTARVGQSGRHGRKTQNRTADFLLGRNVVNKIVLSRSRDAEYCVFKVRDTLETQDELKARLANEFTDLPQTVWDRAHEQLALWVGRKALEGEWLVPDEYEVRREWWTAEQIKQHLHGLRQYSPGCITKDKPRRDPQDSSAVMIDCGGKLYHMDGRRRMNLWMQVPSLYSVLIVKAERCD